MRAESRHLQNLTIPAETMFAKVITRSLTKYQEILKHFRTAQLAQAFEFGFLVKKILLDIL